MAGGSASRTRWGIVMSNGTNWYSWLSLPLFAPFSGAVTQDIRTVVGRGDPATEAEIAIEVGLGRQLGIISEALDALAAELESRSPPALVASLDRQNEKSKLGKLRVMVEEISGIKDRNRQAALKDAKEAIARLERLEPGAAKTLVGDPK